MVDVNQEEALEVLHSGINVFLTGNAGAGKTHLIREFVKTSKKNVAVSATTGIAALNSGGETVHRLLGLGILARPEEAYRVINKWEKRKTSPKPWDKAAWNMLKNLDVLVIDEVSMLRRDQFELIDAVLSNVLDNPVSFGGLQVILVGDFCQLPPVVTGHDLASYPDLHEPYCFQSSLWNHGKFTSLNLNTNFRQEDKKFLNILDTIRFGDCPDEVDAVMTSRLDQKFNSNVKPIKLFPYKKDVAYENITSLKALKKDIFMSEAEYEGKQHEVDILKKDCQAEEKLYFCEGAQVMMITNHHENLWVNGTMGIVLGANPMKIELASGGIVYPEAFTWERYVHQNKGKKIERKVVAKMTQVPFKLAYASTIHKSQGLTLDYVDLDLSSCFTSGQAYVALSRVKTLNGLSLRGWDKSVVKADAKVKRFYSIITNK